MHARREKNKKKKQHNVYIGAPTDDTHQRCHQTSCISANAPESYSDKLSVSPPTLAPGTTTMV